MDEGLPLARLDGPSGDTTCENCGKVAEVDAETGDCRECWTTLTVKPSEAGRSDAATFTREAWAFLDHITSQDYAGQKVDVDVTRLDQFRAYLRTLDATRPSGDEALRAALDSIMAKVRLALVAGDVNATYSASHVALLVRRAVDDTFAALATPSSTPDNLK